MSSGSVGWARAGGRREFLGSLAGALLAPVEALAASVKPVRIRDVDLFSVSIPARGSKRPAGVVDSFSVAKIVTDAGVTGYSFAGPSRADLPKIKQVLLGQDLFAVQRHLQNGLLEWGGVEHAVWDAIGKIAGQPVYRLLGGAKDRAKAYLTCVWHGKPDQSDVSYGEQAAMAARLQKAGFLGMKIRAWRPNPLDDAEACREIRSAVGPNFAILFDRTAHAPQSEGQKIWDYKTGLAVARALERHGAYWLEEPFARDDYQSPARLAAEVNLRIAGGEGYQGLEPFRECLRHKSYDVLNPEGRRCGGIYTCVKIAAMAEAFGVPCVLHGAQSLSVAGALQASLAIGAEWQEFILFAAPLMPHDHWEPGLDLLRDRGFYRFENGDIVAPEVPGIGLDVDEEALGRFRK